MVFTFMMTEQSTERKSKPQMKKKGKALLAGFLLFNRHWKLTPLEMRWESADQSTGTPSFSSSNQFKKMLVMRENPPAESSYVIPTDHGRIRQRVT